MSAKNEKQEQPQEEPQPEPTTELTEIRDTTEAAFVAWTEIIHDGVAWNITLREGISPEKLVGMFAAIKAAKPAAEKVLGEDAVYFVGKERRDYYPAAPTTDLPERDVDTADDDASQRQPQPRQQQGGGYTQHGVSWAEGVAEFGREPNADGQYVHIVDRILVSGTKDAPRVEMFSHNPNLQYPIAKVPSGMACGILTKAYYELTRDNLDYLFDVGEEVTVRWIVTLVQSPKNEKWRDLDDIEIPSMQRSEEPEGEAHPAGPAIDAGNGRLRKPLVANSTDFWKWVNKDLLLYTGIGKDKMKSTALAAYEQTDEDWQEAAQALYDQYVEKEETSHPDDDNIPF